MIFCNSVGSVDVMGAVLSGSQARGGMATDRSDFDVYVITTAGWRYRVDTAVGCFGW
jgi:predicted nucleotidyltransferase